MRREIRQPPPKPASSCPRCFKPGHASEDQDSHAGGQLNKRIRFDCQCGFEWLADRLEAEAHGRFLQRLQPRIDP